MKRLILFIATALFVLSPGYSRGKAPKEEKVQNVIFIIGDGMGLGAAASWMISQDYAPTCFDRAQYIGLCKTYSKNNRVTDSAASGTALGTGNKTNNGMVGMLPDGTKVQNLTEYAKTLGKATGVVVTSYVEDATPGGFLGHVKNRNQGSDIARDIVNLKPDVVVGGGRKDFVKTKDGGETLLDKAKEAGFTYVDNPDDFMTVTQTPVLGLFSDGSYEMAIDHGTDFLPDMVTHTLDLLDDNKNGFFLMVEGSHIDHAEHANNAEQLLFEMEEFDKTVNAAFDYADAHKGTLVVVTADHETGAVYVLSNDRDYTKGESGVNIKFATNGHSALLVPLYAYGAGASNFSVVMENTDVSKKVRALLGK